MVVVMWRCPRDSDGDDIYFFCSIRYPYIIQTNEKGGGGHQIPDLKALGNVQ